MKHALSNIPKWNHSNREWRGESLPPAFEGPSELGRGARDRAPSVFEQGACRARERIAAKVYHPSSRRTAANKQLYQVGRDVLDSEGRPVLARDWRMQKACS